MASGVEVSKDRISQSSSCSSIHMAHVSKKWFQDAANRDLKSERSLAESEKLPIPVKKVFSNSRCVQEAQLHARMPKVKRRSRLIGPVVDK